MEYQKIINLLDTTSNKVPRFNIKKWIEGKVYNIDRQTRFKTSMLQSETCDHSDAYIFVRRTINVTNWNNHVYDKKFPFKNNAPFISFITKINNTLVDNAEDLDIVMPIYNLIEYSKNYSERTRSL